MCGDRMHRASSITSFLTGPPFLSCLPSSTLLPGPRCSVLALRMQEFKGKASTSFHRGVVDRVVCPADLDFYATCSRDSSLRSAPLPCLSVILKAAPEA